MLVPPSSSSKWIRCYKPRPRAKLRLVCIPYAGAGASTFRLWGDALPQSVEVWAVQPPGREERLAETPFTSRGELVAALADALVPRLVGPFCIFGHSMGARVAFELARVLRSRRAPAPEHLFVSGRPAPHLPSARGPLYDLPHDQFIDTVKRMNGTPKELFDEPELLELVLPILRADFTVNEKEPHVDAAPLDCPITAFGGQSDEVANAARIAEWRAHTTGPFEQFTFPGDHFFLVSGRDALLARLASCLAPYAR